MINILLSSGERIAAYWLQHITGGAGGYMIETANAPFSVLAGLLEDASYLMWTDDTGETHQWVYTSIRYLSQNDGRVLMILNEGVGA